MTLSLAQGEVLEGVAKLTDFMDKVNFKPCTSNEEDSMLV